MKSRTLHINLQSSLGSLLPSAVCESRLNGWRSLWTKEVGHGRLGQSGRSSLGLHLELAEIGHFPVHIPRPGQVSPIVSLGDSLDCQSAVVSGEGQMRSLVLLNHILALLPDNLQFVSFSELSKFILPQVRVFLQSHNPSGQSRLRSPKITSDFEMTTLYQYCANDNQKFKFLCIPFED